MKFFFVFLFGGLLWCGGEEPSQGIIISFKEEDIYIIYLFFKKIVSQNIKTKLDISWTVV